MMRATVVVVVLLLACAASSALELRAGPTAELQVGVGTVRSARDTLEKWFQEPDFSSWSNLYASYWNANQQVLGQSADDFYCSDGSTIVRVEWWGLQMMGEIFEFHIDFFADVPGPPFGHPGGAVSQSIIYQWTQEDLPGDWGRRYAADLPIPFQQEAGTVYWVSVVAYMREGWQHAAEWYWRGCIPGDAWNSEAVHRWFGPPDRRDWAPMGDDLAFALYADGISPVEAGSWGRVKSLFR